MKLTIGPSSTTKGAYTRNTIVFENKKEEENFFKILKDNGVSYTVEQEKYCCLEGDRICSNCGSCTR